MAQKAPKASKASKALKEVDPDAPKKAPNAWILFTGRVRAALKGAGLPAGKEAQQYASYLKKTYPEAYEMGEEAILEHHGEWTPPPPKPKEEKEEEEPKPKAKRVLTEEHKAKMAAGRKAAAERRKAEAAAKEAEAALKALEGEEEEAESPRPAMGGGGSAAAAAPKAAVPSPKAKVPPKAPTTLTTLPFKGKKLLWDKETGGCWENKGGEKGAWLGVLEGTGKDRVLKADEPEPEEE